MSYHLIAVAQEQPISDRLARVLSRICKNVDDNHLFWEPVATVANDINKCLRQTKSCFSELEKLGYITDTGKRYGDTNQIKEYKINLSERVRKPAPLKSADLCMKECGNPHTAVINGEREINRVKPNSLRGNSWQDRLMNDALERQEKPHTNGNHDTSVSKMKRIIDIIKDSQPGEHHEQD